MSRPFAHIPARKKGENLKQYKERISKKKSKSPASSPGSSMKEVPPKSPQPSPRPSPKPSPRPSPRASPRHSPKPSPKHKSHTHHSGSKPTTKPSARTVKEDGTIEIEVQINPNQVRSSDGYLLPPVPEEV